MGHSYRTLLWDTLVGHSCRTLLWVTLRGTLVGNSCGTLLWDTLVGNSCCGTLLLLWDTLVGHCCETLLSLTSDMPRLHQHVSRSPVARRIPNQGRAKSAWHGRNFATRSATYTRSKHKTYHTIPPIIPPATRRVYTSMFPAPRGMAPRKRTSRANPHGTAGSRT